MRRSPPGGVELTARFAKTQEGLATGSRREFLATINAMSQIIRVTCATSELLQAIWCFVVEQILFKAKGQCTETSQRAALGILLPEPPPAVYAPVGHQRCDDFTQTARLARARTQHPVQSLLTLPPNSY